MFLAVQYDPQAFGSPALFIMFFMFYSDCWEYKTVLFPCYACQQVAQRLKVFVTV